MKIDEVRRANPKWFCSGNKAFFNDISYDVRCGKSGNPFLVQNTYGWTDMLGGKKTAHYRIHPLDPMSLKIGHLVDDIFKDMGEVEEWLQEN